MGQNVSAPAAFGTASAIAKAVGGGERSAVDVINEHLDRIAAHDDEVKAYNLVMADGAREAAAALDERLAAGETPGPVSYTHLTLPTIPLV